MYAIVKINSHQYRVEPESVLTVELLDAEVGASVTLDEVLLLSDGDEVRVGTPTVEGCRVAAEVVRHGLGPKLRIFKKKARNNYRRHTGHRQPFTEIVIKEIAAS